MMNLVKKALYSLVLLVWVTGCQPDASTTEPTGVDLSEGTRSTRGGHAEVGCRTPKGAEMLEIAGVPVSVKVPEAKTAYMGDILVLHGWNEHFETWCKRSRLCLKATKKGFRVIMPDMDKSMYMMRAYAETREDWQTLPTFAWLRDSLIQGLQTKHCLLAEKGQNFVVGVSAGARGVIRLLQETPELFVAGAALSGDYNPAEMRGDNIYRGFLGEYEGQEERWKTTENIAAHVDRIRVPVYLGHGKKDDNISYEQTEHLYNVLRAAHPSLNVRLNLTSKGHGYTYRNFRIP
ncbi:MAG: prolyl oligopeptidase family serine peptidase, partial [Bacteroidota bacterium]